MNSYIVNESERARNDIRRIIDYLTNKKGNPIAAESVLDDYFRTAEKLSYLADSLPVPNEPGLRGRGLKRMNFTKHNYFMLFAIKGENIMITNIFHASEDYENKL